MPTRSIKKKESIKMCHKTHVVLKGKFDIISSIEKDSHQHTLCRNDQLNNLYRLPCFKGSPYAYDQTNLNRHQRLFF